jgi:hypothetical protein
VEKMLDYLFKKRLLKGIVFLMVILMLLPLIGCNNEAAVLKEMYMKSRGIESSRVLSTLTVVNKVPREQLNQEAQAVFSLLEKGITMEIAMADQASMNMTIAPRDKNILRQLGVWPYAQEPSLDFFVDQGKMGMKTSADQRYLVIDPAEATNLMDPDSNIDFSALYQQIYNEQLDSAWEFLKSFVQDFDFTLSRVEQLGEVKLELPDGTIDTRGLRIELDFEETLALITYTLEYLTRNEAFKDYIMDSMRRPIEQMIASGTIPPEEIPSEEEMKQLIEMPYQEFQKMLVQAVEYLKTVSPAKLKEQYGLDISATVEYYLDSDNFIRKTVDTYNIKAEHEKLKPFLGTPLLDLTVHSEQITWDLNKPVKVVFPPEEEQISFFALLTDPALQEVQPGDGPLSLLINLFQSFGDLTESGTSLILNLERNLSFLNGQEIKLEPSPYYEGETLMVPFRALAELAGGKVNWFPETKKVQYQGEQIEIEFFPNSNQALVNGETVELAKEIVIKADRVMVPVELFNRLTKHPIVHQERQIAVFNF